MTNPSPQTSTIAGAIKIVRAHGLVRNVPLVLAMLLVGLMDGLRVAAVFPVLAIVTEGTACNSSRVNAAIGQALDFFHLPHNLAVLCALMLGLTWIKAVINLRVSKALGRIGATIGQEIR